MRSGGTTTRLARAARGTGGLAVALLWLFAITPVASAFTVKDLGAFPDTAPRWALLVSDLDEDGKDDIVAASACAITVQYAQAPAVYTTMQTLPTGEQPCSAQIPQIDVGDLNSDGYEEIVLANGSLWVYPGTGSRSFGTPFNYTGQGATSVALADLDNNDEDDIVSTLSGPLQADIGVILNPPINGPFGSQTVYQQDFLQIRKVLVGQFTDDANLDVAYAGARCPVLGSSCSTPSGGVMVLPGHGNGTLGTLDADGRSLGFFTATNDGGSLPAGLLAAPLRGLARQDLVLTDPFVATLLPAADGQLTEKQRLTGLFGRAGHGDLNQDEVEDIVLVRPGPPPAPGSDQGSQAGPMTLLLGAGDGSFDVEQNISIGSNESPEDVAITDIDADGWPDAVVLQRGSLRAVFNTPTGQLDREQLSLGASLLNEAATPKTVIAVNVGARPLNTGAAQISGPQAAEFSVIANGCDGKTLAVLDSCEIKVGFTPAAVGQRSAQLNLASDDPLGSDLQAALIGIGAALPSASAATPPPAASPADKTPPSVKAGAVARQRLKAVLAKGLKVTVGCSEACTIRLRLLLNAAQAKRLHISAARNVLLVSRSVRLPQAGQTQVTMKLPKRLITAARKQRRLDLQLTADAADSAGNPAPRLVSKLLVKR